MPVILSRARWRPRLEQWRRKGVLQGLVLCAVAAVLAFGAPAPANAQFGLDVTGKADSAETPPPSSTKPAEPVDTQALAALILILENPTLRQQLLQFIKQQAPPAAAAAAAGGGDASADANAAADPATGPAPGEAAPGTQDTPPESPEASMIRTAVDAVQDGVTQFLSFLENAVALERLTRWVQVQASSNELSNFWIDFLFVITTILASAIAVYWLVVRFLRRLSAVEPKAGPLVRRHQVLFLIKQLAVLAAALAAYSATAYLLFVILTVPSRTEGVVLDIVTTIGLGLALCTFLRILLCPYHPSMRLMGMRDEAAQDLFYRLRFLILWITAGRAVFENIHRLQVPSGMFEGLERLWGLTALVLTIILVLRYRTDITEWIVTTEGRFVLVRRFLSRMWMPAYFAYAIGSYVIWALDIKGASTLVAQGTFATFVIMFLVQPVALALERWLEKAENSTFGIESAVIQARLHRYADFAGRFAKAAVYAIAAILIAYAWDMDVAALAGTYLSGPVLDVVGELLLIVVISLALWEVFDLSLAVYMDATDDETGTRVQRSARTRTLVPLLRTIVIGFLLIIMIAATLNSLGLDIAPLLATAGIVGIAIGFGAQKLVQDVITGLFMLFQDTISVGDIVELGGIAGTVQRLTIRTIELRDIEGNLYTIPFSSVDTVKNMTREFAFAMIDVGIAYRENADHVMELLKHMGAELENHPVHGPNILSSIEVMGVQDLADSAVIIRCRFKTAPLTQFGIRRAFLGLVKRRFDELGIEIPFPQRTLHYAQPFEQPAFSSGPQVTASDGVKE